MVVMVAIWTVWVKSLPEVAVVVIEMKCCNFVSIAQVFAKLGWWTPHPEDLILFYSFIVFPLVSSNILSPRQTPPEQKKFQNEYRIHFYQIITFNFLNFFPETICPCFRVLSEKLIGETIYYNTKTWKKITTYELNNFLHDCKFLIA